MDKGSKAIVKNNLNFPTFFFFKCLTSDKIRPCIFIIIFPWKGGLASP